MSHKTNKEKQEYARSWSKKNSHKLKGYKKRSQQKDPLRYKINTLKNTLTSHWKIKVTREELEEKLRNTNVCIYCQEPISVDELSMDHIIPRSRNGKDIWSNIHFIHKRCNMLKGNLLHNEFLLLLSFLNLHSDMKKLIESRLLQSGFMWRKH